jgi:hypothetical protein
MIQTTSIGLPGRPLDDLMEIPVPETRIYLFPALDEAPGGKNLGFSGNPGRSIQRRRRPVPSPENCRFAFYPIRLPAFLLLFFCAFFGAGKKHCSVNRVSHNDAKLLFSPCLNRENLWSF